MHASPSISRLLVAIFTSSARSVLVLSFLLVFEVVDEVLHDESTIVSGCRCRHGAVTVLLTWRKAASSSL